MAARHHYDAAGNHIRSDYPDGSSESFEYDRINRLIAHIDGLGAKTEYELAVDGLPVKRTNALGHTFGYRYDQARRLTTLTNENGDTYRLDYDNTGNLIQETGWDGKITGYAYDAAGQLSEQTEYGLSDGLKADRPEIWHIHRFKRNILGQLVEKTSRRIDGTPVPAEEGKHYSRTRFDYDPLTGNLIKARNRHSSVELVYDVLDQLVSETTVHNGQSATVGYQYDPLGNRTQTVLPDGRSINYLYYGSGHLHQINLDGEVISDIERDRLHQEIQRTQGALTSRYDYDPMGRLKHQTATANRTLQHNGKLNTLVGGAVRRSYRYDQAGNLIQTADQRSGVLDYVYDKLGRIESAVNKQTGSSEKFAFDPAHNILSDNVSDGLKDTQGLSENLSDRPHTGRLKGRNIGKGNRLEAYNGTEYTYDALGNMIYRQLPNGESQLFQYDSENQLVLAEIKKNSGESQTWEYAYDPFGRRLSKERTDKGALTATAPKQTHFVWDGSRLLQEYNYRGSYSYIYTDQDSYEPLAQIFDNAKDGKQYLSYFHNDQIGIPREMTDQLGNLLWYGEYTAWGRLKTDERVYQHVHQPFRLQNQYCDEETGLHYNFFRYYEAETGRFTNQDPIGLEGGVNLYFFAPNAQGWIDAWGLTRVYHYTSKAGYNGIMGTGVIEARDPGSRGKGAIKGKEKGVYVTTMNPEQLDASKARGQMGLTGEKSTHYISFEVDDSEIKRVDRQDGVKRLYLKDDVQLRDSNNKLKQGIEHGACNSSSKRKKGKKKGK
ncbi:RHS repeat-associated core domain-containing protein [Neisseria canis]|uniref:Cell wall-associated polypeptide CWBP200 n=3 Tax=Neisseria canis TaxID=493 RepID=A0A448D738_9NEIS|nr:RHS repeat-associated core domain-containing protein [Neisseria canis]VEF00440.1 Cell wall-associated polypeptide CWBP200 [Neisseria canis]